MELNLGEDAKAAGAAKSSDGAEIRHSAQFVEQYYANLEARPARKTWEDFKKEKQSALEKFGGDADMLKYRRELDRAREEILAKKRDERKSKKRKKDKSDDESERKKSKKDKKKKKEEKREKEKKHRSDKDTDKRKRRRDESDDG